MKGAWLLRLYPRPWRDRYGDEMAAMLADIRLTPTAIIDLIAGAIDARITPQNIPGQHSAVPTEKEKVMLRSMLKACTTGPQLTKQDQWIGAGVMLGLTLVFSGIYVWASNEFRGNDLVDAFGIMTFPAAMLLSSPFTYMKGRSRASQIVMIGGCLIVLAALSVLTARL